MKKPSLVLALLLFAACAIVGYLVASRSNPTATSAASSSVANQATAMAAAQQNFLLVQVDDLTQSSPKLVQVWIVLTYYSNPPQVMFIPLYPSYDGSQNSTIAEAFTLTSAGSVSERFISKIAELYKVEVDGAIMTDAAGYNGFANWFGISNIQVSTAPAGSDDEKHALLLNSQTFFQNVCGQLTTGNAAGQFESIQWSQLIPGHFNTNLSFEVLMASWDRVIRSEAPQVCKVLSTE
ncbi:MAG: hypothetical protein GYA58_00400 [Anaerolineaceae bacterium]|jgi:hypothetical protein|nr:hypothetical protein [Anaerolineaceae bacterium]